MRKIRICTLEILLLACMLIGCGAEEEASAPAVLLKVFPESGSTVPVNGSIALEFNKRPVNFSIDLPNTFAFADEPGTLRKSRNFQTGMFSPNSSKTVIIFGPFNVPVTEIKVYWGPDTATESATISYTITGPI